MAENATAPDRRPIASRDTAWARAVAAWLARVGASPNGISVAGMLAGVAGGACLGATSLCGDSPVATRLLFAGGAVFTQLRLLANMFDGMVAVNTGRTSPVGEIYNEAPDRVSDAATLVGAGCALHSDPTLGYVAAMLAIFVAYVRTLGKSAGAPNDFCGPMAKQQRMALIIASSLYLAIAPAFATPDRLTDPPRSLLYYVLWLIIAGCVVTASRRLARISKALREKRP